MEDTYDAYKIHTHVLIPSGLPELATNFAICAKKLKNKTQPIII